MKGRMNPKERPLNLTRIHFSREKGQLVATDSALNPQNADLILSVIRSYRRRDAKEEYY